MKRIIIMNLFLAFAWLPAALEAGEVTTQADTLDPRIAIATLSGLRTAYQASPDHGVASANAIMACVKLCLAGHPAEFGCSGGWRATARLIARERSAYRKGKPAATWKEAMPELWTRLLSGEFIAVRDDIGNWKEAKSDLMGRVLLAYATRDAGDLKSTEGPWARMALLWCERTATVPEGDPTMDIYQVKVAETLYHRFGHSVTVNRWVADVAWMLRSVEIRDTEAVPLLTAMAVAMGVAQPPAGREALIQLVERTSARVDVVTVPVFSAALNAIDRGLQGSRGMTGKTRTLVGLGDVAGWLADRSRFAFFSGARVKGYLSETNPLMPLLATHGDWFSVVRLAYNLKNEARQADAADVVVKALEHELLAPRHTTGYHMMKILNLLGNDPRVAGLMTRILERCDTDDPALVTICISNFADGPHLGLLQERLAHAYERGDHSLHTVWYLGQLSPGPMLVLGDRKADASWVDATVDNTTLPWPQFGESNSFAIVWRGNLQIPKDGTYELATCSDDGSRLSVDGACAVNNAGSHGMETRSRSLMLKAGWHPLVLEFEQGGGGGGCQLLWRQPGEEKASIIPAHRLSHGEDRLAGLQASGYRLGDPKVHAEVLAATLPALLVQAAAEQPKNLALQFEVCRRSSMMHHKELGIDAARRIGAMAVAGSYQFTDHPICFASADIASHILATASWNWAGKDIEKDMIVALMRVSSPMDYISPIIMVQRPEKLRDEGRYYDDGQHVVRQQFYWGLVRSGLLADPRLFAARRAKGGDGPTELHLQQICALASGDLRAAHTLHAQRLKADSQSDLSADERSESAIEDALLTRLFDGKEPDPVALDQQLQKNGNPEVYVLASQWVTGRIPWAEADAARGTIKDGDALLYLRGLYLLTIGQQDQAILMLQQMLTTYPTWSEIPKCQGLIAALAKGTLKGLPQAKPLARDAEAAVKSKSDF